MLLCDTSVVDWSAVGALGTWAVGLAAIFVAWKANGIASNLRAAEQARSEKAARALAAGLRIEILTYWRAMTKLGVRLEALANDRSPDTDVPGHAVAAHEEMRLVEFPDKSNMVALLPYMPEELAKKISSLQAVQKAADATFVGNVNYWREQRQRPSQSHQTNLNSSAAELGRLAAKVEEIVDALSDYLAISPEDRKRAMV